MGHARQADPVIALVARDANARLAGGRVARRRPAAILGVAGVLPVDVDQRLPARLEQAPLHERSRQFLRFFAGAGQRPEQRGVALEQQLVNRARGRDRGVAAERAAIEPPGFQAFLDTLDAQERLADGRSLG